MVAGDSLVVLFSTTNGLCDVGVGVVTVGDAEELLLAADTGAVTGDWDDGIGVAVDPVVNSGRRVTSSSK